MLVELDLLVLWGVRFRIGVVWGGGGGARVMALKRMAVMGFMVLDTDTY